MDGFTELIDGANGFFAELAQNNRKDWYEPRKADYIANIKKPGEFLAELLAEDLNRLTGVAHKPKLFRIHRDVRFSKDKRPYNPHLHLMWSAPEATAPGWFLGSAPDYLLVGMGLMGLQGAALTQYRNFIDRNGAALQAAIAKSGAQISDWGPAPLKRVPRPFDPEHAQGELLKRKALALTLDLPEDWRNVGLVKAAQGCFQSLLPAWRLMRGLTE